MCYMSERRFPLSEGNKGLADPALTSMGPGVRVQGRPACHTPKYLEVINQARKQLGQMCLSSYLDKYTFFTTRKPRLKFWLRWLLGILTPEHGSMGRSSPSPRAPALDLSSPFWPALRVLRSLSPVTSSRLFHQLELSFGVICWALPSGFCTYTQFLPPLLTNLFPVSPGNPSVVLTFDTVPRQ